MESGCIVMVQPLFLFKDRNLRLFINFYNNFYKISKKMKNICIVLNKN